MGLGVAVLCGTHPELPPEALTATSLEYDPAQAEHVQALAARLAAFQGQRQQFWLALLLACCGGGERDWPAAAGGCGARHD